MDIHDPSQSSDQPSNQRSAAHLRTASAIFLGLALVLALVYLGRSQIRSIAMAREAGSSPGSNPVIQTSTQVSRSSNPAATLPPFTPAAQDGLILPGMLATGDLSGDFTAFTTGITRQLDPETHSPPRPRTEVITYTVKTGDNLFDIAEKFGLKPETMLWSNQETLEDNPHLLAPDMVLNILPTDGAYYQWKEGDTVEGVAAQYEVEPSAILDYAGNDVDLTDTSGSYGLVAGDWVIVEGGKRELRDWGPPAISRSNPAVAAHYGPGNCGAISSGAMGTGGFVWPTVAHFLSGYHYSAIHRGIDIGGAMGNAIFAADSGVVVYAGWSNYGYGNLIVVDHGTGWQTVYAHLSAFSVGCGDSVYQGAYIGAMGSTGNSSGPHLHFEMIYNGTKPNPMDYVQ